MTFEPFKQLVLLVLDGFGVASSSPGNAVVAANPRNLNYLINNFPAITLQASGPSVGLPWGERGNSEVGHLNLGAGRIVNQDLPRISQDIRSNQFFKNKSLLAAADHVRQNKSKLHLVGLVSSGGVHSAEEHLYALMALAAEQKIDQVFIHMFTDGRDTPAKEAVSSLDRLTRKIVEIGIGKVASVTGRFYAMDRGQHWELTERIYRALVEGKGEQASSPREAILANYAKQIFDETIPPTVIVEGGQPVAKIEAGDAVVFFNFRPDRAAQLTEAFAQANFDKFFRGDHGLHNVFFVTMTLYKDSLPVNVAYPPLKIKNGLCEVLSQHQLSQFHIAESEKYAHVTSFFNGGIESPWPGEERQIVTSPATYQKRYEDVPQMSVDKVTDAVIDKVNSGINFVLANFANADMVGHTGNQEACVTAVQAIDRSIGRIFEDTFQKKVCFVVTADHGNIEEILNLQNGRVSKEHSRNPVPFIVAGNGLQQVRKNGNGYLDLSAKVPEGILGDVAPTVLELMGIKKPKEMSGTSLLSFLLTESFEA